MLLRLMSRLTSGETPHPERRGSRFPIIFAPFKKLEPLLYGGQQYIFFIYQIIK
jgi:hypothetical protein